MPSSVVVVGDGERAAAWRALIVRSSRLRLAGAVDTLDFGAPTADTRDLCWAVALEPRASFRAALALAEHGRASLVAAPIHALGARELSVPGGARAVQVAHGWCSLAGRRTVEQWISARPGTRIEIEVAGTPHGAGGDVADVIGHAAAIACRLLGVAEPELADVQLGGATLRGAARELRLRWHVEGQGLEARLGDGAGLVWSWRADEETLRIGDRVRTQRTESADVRALHQLAAPEDAGGDDLLSAWRALRLAAAILDRLPGLGLAGARSLARSAGLRRGTSTELGALGLAGALPPGPTVRSLAVSVPSEPFEVFAFRSGLKPVAFLTVAPNEVEATSALFGAAHVERRERRVAVGLQDEWDDRRQLGEPRVELYVSRDPSLARRAAALQERDPSLAVEELGALMGYPGCCVRAFARQPHRANNSLNRYACASRTLPGSSAWPWELDDLSLRVVAFHPCSYRCEAALAQARAIIAEAECAHPGVREALHGALARPVLYFDHDHQLTLTGTDRTSVVDGRVRYGSVELGAGGGEFADLAAAIALGDELDWSDDALRVWRAGTPVLELLRVDPGLGLLARFD